jgi:AICAR transformylase/IMP cyclohydrolase PurH
MPDLVRVHSALLSVSDKTGLAEFATALHREFGVELISTGGTARFLREQGLPVTDVSEVTQFPEMMDGRVKTLHPAIHGGLLALRDNPEHVAAMQTHGIKPIDLVCVNLYPFEQTISKPGVSFDEAIENIDIGGPSMIRSAAKNHRSVLVVTSPDRYQKVLGDLREHNGSTCGKHRLKQAQRAYAHTGAYDAKIAEYLDGVISPTKGKPSQASSGPPFGSEELAERLIRAQAVSVGATEAAAFAAEDPSKDGSPLRLLHHIRPDDATAKERAAATAAFEQIIKAGLRHDKDGALEIDYPGRPTDRPPQFCLFTLWRRSGQVVGASAVIARCADSDEAQKRLKVVQSIVSAVIGENESAAPADGLPARIELHLTKKQELRYGENPHQKAAAYVSQKPKEASVLFAEQLHGKELSYINLLDADAALSAVKELAGPGACIVKHATPCGFATAADLPTAFANAFAGDPLAAFGGIVAVNRKMDLSSAQAIIAIDKLLEVIVAPGYAPDALELLRSRWKNVRLLDVGDMGTPKSVDRGEMHLHRIVGGYLVQERDLLGGEESNWKVVSQRQPSAEELANLKLAWLACKHVKSNAIVLARESMMIGSGAGQQDRVNACRIAIQKAGSKSRGAVAASDAFFPFPDGPQLLLDAGVTAIIHPGGSLRDGETLDVVNRAGAAMILTGQRHFKH